MPTFEVFISLIARYYSWVIFTWSPFPRGLKIIICFSALPVNNVPAVFVLSYCCHCLVFWKWRDHALSTDFHGLSWLHKPILIALCMCDVGELSGWVCYVRRRNPARLVDQNVRRKTLSKQQKGFMNRKATKATRSLQPKLFSGTEFQICYETGQFSNASDCHVL